MSLTIEEKANLETFVSIFQILKCWSSSVSIHFLQDNMTIQIMDKSQICFTFIQLDKTWFSKYDENMIEQKATVQSTQLAVLMNHALKHDILEIVLNNEDNDKIQFNCFEKKNRIATEEVEAEEEVEEEVEVEEVKEKVEEEENKEKKEANKKSKAIKEKTGIKEKKGKNGKKHVEKDLEKDKKKNNQYISHFELLLLDIEEDEFTIPDIEYDVDFTLDAKKFTDILHEIEAFGDTLHIIASEEHLYFQTTGDCGTIKIDYPIDNLEEYSISEGITLSLHYSLSHLIRLCTSNKLSEHVIISLHESYPMCIKYNITEKSYASFYMAGKMVDED